MFKTFTLVLPPLLAAALAGQAASAEGALAALSIACAAAAFVAMALNLLLSTRLRPLEYGLGGLDRLYASHKTLGIAFISLILTHYLIKPSGEGKTLSTATKVLAEQAGQLAFWMGLLLLTFSLLKPKKISGWHGSVGLPYPIWRLSHRLMGLVFLAAVVHQNFIGKPFNANSLAAYYLNFFSAVGIAAFSYTQLAPHMRRRRYEVVAIEKHAGVTTVSAAPLTRRHVVPRPGQFCFFRARKAGMWEPHPFTVAGIGEGGRVRLAIKGVGDFTCRVGRDLHVGDLVDLEGPYGDFTFDRGGHQQVWLAAGIGITPFLAALPALELLKHGPIDLVYVVRSAPLATALGEIQMHADAGSIRLHLHETATHGRLDADALLQYVGGDLRETVIWYCGPVQLRRDLVRQLTRAGQAPRAIEYEKFAFR